MTEKTPAVEGSGEAPAAPRRKRGAPRKNVSAARDPEAALMLRVAKDAARVRADRFRREADAEAAEILQAVGLGGNPLAVRIGRRLADVEEAISRLRAFGETRGRMTQRGDLKPTFERYLALQAQDRAELRALLEKLAEVVRNEPPEAVEYRCFLHDGLPVDAPPDAVDAVGALPEPAEAVTPPVVAAPVETPAARKLAKIRAEYEARTRPSPAVTAWVRGDDLED